MEQLERAIEEIRNGMPSLELREEEIMAEHCSFRIGGPVRALALPADRQELTQLCRILARRELAPFILGNGTNILFPDEGLKDLLILSTEKLDGLCLRPDGSVYAEAGVSLARLAGFAQQNGLAGLEFASGIPGSVGGGVMMNAGAYGGELKDAVESVSVLRLPELECRELGREECAFEYRGSAFRKMPGCVILGASFRLIPGEPEQIAARMRELNARRREKQPLELPSAGSTFKRPAGGFAAALIDEAGLKGLTVGGAKVSEKHAGFVVNAGSASARDVRELMDRIRRAVLERSGVLLEPEVILLPPDFRQQTGRERLQ